MPQKAFLHVDFEQPEELVFNRARMRRAFVKLGHTHKENGDGGGITDKPGQPMS